MAEPSIGESFRRLGQDISGAMTAPIEARLRALSIKRGMEAEEKQAAALRDVGKAIGEEAAIALRAGVPLRDFLLLKENQEANEFNYLYDILDPPKLIDADNTRKNMRASENVVSNMDDPTKLDASMDSANANFDAGKKSADFITENDNLFKDSIFGRTGSDSQPALVSGNKKKDSEFLSMVKGRMEIKRGGKLKGGVAGWLNDPKKTYDIPLTGIPSLPRAETYMIAAITHGALSKEDAAEVLGTESEEGLYKIANSKDEPEAKRILATYIAGAYSSYEIATKATIQVPPFTDPDGNKYVMNKRTGEMQKVVVEEVVAGKQAEKAEEIRREHEKTLRALEAANQKRMKEIQTELSKSTNTILRNDPPKIELQKLENRANIYVNRGERIPEIEINKLGNFIEERAGTFEAKAGQALGKFLTTGAETQINKAQNLMEFVIQYNTQVGKGASPESGISEREPVFQPAFQIPPPTGTKDQIKRSSADKLIRDGKVTEEQLRETYDIVP